MTSEVNKRIAKNTFFMYIRMALVMGITLYTSRIILNALGEEDFGIYSVIGGTVVFFTFLSNSMATALQRFLAYAIGENNKIKLINYFNQGFWTFCLIALSCIVLCETLGLIILYNYIDIPIGKHQVALWVFQLALVNLVIGLLRIPYIGLIIAYEKMNFFAIQGIIEVIMKLAIAFAVAYTNGQRLIEYMFLLMLVAIINNIYTVAYCKRKFPYCKLKFEIEPKTIKSLISFSGWTVMTSASNVLSNQGVAIVLNNIFGVLMSAAVGITNQVMSALTSFLGSFQTAFHPQIIKSYASGDIRLFNSMLFRMSLFSFYLMMIIGIPLIINMAEIMNIWLTEVPQWTIQFSICIVLVFIIESYSGPFWMGMQAVGNIRNYQIIISSLISLNFILSIILLYNGFSAIWAYIIKILVAITVLFGRVMLLNRFVSISLKEYWINIVLRSSLCFGLSLLLNYTIKPYFSGFIGLLLTISISILISSVLILSIGLPSIERNYIYNLVKKKLL